MWLKRTHMHTETYKNRKYTYTHTHMCWSIVRHNGDHMRRAFSALLVVVVYYVHTERTCWFVFFVLLSASSRNKKGNQHFLNIFTTYTHKPTYMKREITHTCDRPPKHVCLCVCTPCASATLLYIFQLFITTARGESQSKLRASVYVAVEWGQFGRIHHYMCTICCVCVVFFFLSFYSFRHKPAAGYGEVLLRHNNTVSIL